MKYFSLTSESVSEGHPDKIADQIADSILDAILSKDKKARVACEILIKNNIIIISGEINTIAYINIEKITKTVIKKIGYDREELHFNSKKCKIINAISKQSPEISESIKNKKFQNAGDQGIIFGFATNETPNLMPATIHYAHKLIQRHSYLRKSKKIYWLRPDAKTQITINYINNKPSSINNIIFSTQHNENIKQKTIKEAIIEEIIYKIIPKKWIIPKTKYYINPTKNFTNGGPTGDCGVTGRKIIVDTYGGAARHGGGSFSGKDPSKIDRSGAYMSRYIAKNIVASKLANKCEIQISYSIGKCKPLSIMVNTFGSGKIPDNKIKEEIYKNFKLTPNSIIKTLNLLKPIYQKTTNYGHFGRNDKDFTWEKTDKIYKLNKNNR